MLRPLAIATQSPTKATKKAVGLKSTLESITSARPVQGPVEAPLAKAAREAKEGPAALKDLFPRTPVQRQMDKAKEFVGPIPQQKAKPIKFFSPFGEVEMTLNPEMDLQYRFGDVATKQAIIASLNKQVIEVGMKQGRPVLPQFRNTDIGKAIVSQAGVTPDTLPQDERFRYDPYVGGDMLTEAGRFAGNALSIIPGTIFNLRATNPAEAQIISAGADLAAKEAYKFGKKILPDYEIPVGDTKLSVNELVNPVGQGFDVASRLADPESGFGETAFNLGVAAASTVPGFQGLATGIITKLGGATFRQALAKGLLEVAREGLPAFNYLERKTRVKDLANILERGGMFEKNADKIRFQRQIEQEAKDWASANSKNANEFLEQQDEFYKNLIRPTLNDLVPSTTPGKITVYHGTTGKFKGIPSVGMSRTGAIHVTPDKKFAENFTNIDQPNAVGQTPSIKEFQLDTTKIADLSQPALKQSFIEFVVNKYGLKRDPFDPEFTTINTRTFDPEGYNYPNGMTVEDLADDIDKGQFWIAESEAAKEWAKANGYAGVRAVEDGTETFAIFDNSALGAKKAGAALSTEPQFQPAVGTSPRRMGQMAGELAIPEGERYQQLIPEFKLLETTDDDIEKSVMDSFVQMVGQGVPQEEATQIAAQAAKFAQRSNNNVDANQWLKDNDIVVSMTASRFNKNGEGSFYYTFKDRKTKKTLTQVRVSDHALTDSGRNHPDGWAMDTSVDPDNYDLDLEAEEFAANRIAAIQGKPLPFPNYDKEARVFDEFDIDPETFLHRGREQGQLPKNVRADINERKAKREVMTDRSEAEPYTVDTKYSPESSTRPSTIMSSRLGSANLVPDKTFTIGNTGWVIRELDNDSFRLVNERTGESILYGLRGSNKENPWQKEMMQEMLDKAVARAKANPTEPLSEAETLSRRNEYIAEDSGYTKQNARNKIPAGTVVKGTLEDGTTVTGKLGITYDKFNFPKSYRVGGKKVKTSGFGSNLNPEIEPVGGFEDLPVREFTREELNPNFYKGADTQSPTPPITPKITKFLDANESRIKELESVVKSQKRSLGKNRQRGAYVPPTKDHIEWVARKAISLAIKAGMSVADAVKQVWNDLEDFIQGDIDVTDAMKEKGIADAEAEVKKLYQGMELPSSWDIVLGVTPSTRIEKSKVTVVDAAKVLEDYTRQLLDSPESIKLTPENREVVTRMLANALKKETIAAIKKGGEGQGFYSLNIEDADNALEQMFPGITDTQKKLFHIISSPVSNGNTPDKEAAYGLRLFEQFLNTGKFSPTVTATYPIYDSTGKKILANVGETLKVPGGLSGPVITKSYETMQKVFELFGNDEKKILDFFTTEHSKEDFRKVWKQVKSGSPNFDSFEAGPNGGYYGTMLLGPKVGQYSLNKIGLGGTTKDLWFYRMVNRIAGSLIFKDLDKLKNEFENVFDAGFLGTNNLGKQVSNEATSLAAKELGIDERVLQEITWKNEQNIYNKLGVQRSAGTIREGIEKVAAERGIKLQPMDQAKKDAAQKVINDAQAKVLSSVEGQELYKPVKENIQKNRDRIASLEEIIKSQKRSLGKNRQRGAYIPPTKEEIELLARTALDTVYRTGEKVVDTVKNMVRYLDLREEDVNKIYDSIRGLDQEVGKEIPTVQATVPPTEKEPWQMTRKEFFHPKISQKLFDVASLADNLETIGTVGDFVRGPNTRKLIEPVLDIPVVVLRKIVADGKYVDIPKDMIFGGASGTFKGRQVIFINPDDKQMVKNLFEEIAHSMQYVKGRQGKYSKVDLKQINQNLKFFTGEYLSHPQEVSAKKFADYLSGLKEPTHKDYIQQALAEGKPVPENVLADYPDLTVATTAGPAKPVVSGKILTQTEKEPDLVATANRITEEVRKSVGLDGATKATPEQIADWTEEARKINTSKLMNDMMSGTGNLRPLSKAEELAIGARLSRALERYSSALDELRATDTPSTELLDRIDSARSEIDEISKFSLAVGTEWGKSGVARQALIRADYTTAGVITRIKKQEKLLSKDSSMAVQATKQEMADAEEFARISREKDDKIAALEKKIEDLKAQGAKEAPKRRLELRRQKLESERDDILSQIMGIKSGEKKVPQPKMTSKSGAINIADDVALFELYGKLAKNTIQRGALTIEDVYAYVSEVAKQAGHTLTKQGMIDALDAQMLRGRRKDARRATKAELRARQRLYREVERGATRNVAEREREIAAKEAARKAREEAIQIKKDEIAAKKQAIRAEREAQKATSKAEADAYRAAAKKAREEARALAKQLKEADDKAKLDARQARRAELNEALGPIARDERKIANLKGRIEDYNRMIESGEFFASRALKEGDEGYELTHLQTQLEQLRYEAKMAKQNVDTIIDDLGQPAWKKVLKEVIELPRYMQLGLDAGALTRQGFDIALVSPTAWTKAAKQGFGAAISNPAKVARLEEEFMRDPEVLKAIANGLAIDGPSAMPEGFVSKAAQKIPLYGRGERFHKTFQNFARYETYRNLTRGQNMNQYQLKETAKLINAMTGRGSWSGAQGPLASIFTAPKMYAGQLEVMGKTAKAIVDPRFYNNPAYRKLIVRRWLGRMGGLVALKALADATDWEFSINPDDSDFLKLRNGNTVIDVTGGYSSWYKLLFSTLNDVAESGMSEGFTDKLVRSLGYKVSPTVRTPLSFITGKDAIGKPFFTNPDTGEREMNVQDLAKTFAPLIGMQIYEMAGGDEGYADMDAGAKVALGGLSFIGTGVSNYEAREPSRKPEDTKWGQLLDSIGVQPR